MITEFINHISSVKGYSPLTCKAYEKDLRHFATWAKANLTGARWSTITREDIDLYITEYMERGQKPSTTNRRLAAIAGLYGYMKRQGLPVESPCKFESRRKVEQTIPNTIPAEQLRTAYKNSVGVARVILGLLITTGIRIGELMSLQFHDVDCINNTIKVHGKGAKERVIHVPAEQLYELKCVKEHCSKNGYIFTIPERMVRHMVYDSLTPYCDAPQLSPHAIRHTFATNQALHGENVSTIATTLGHNHLETTQKYIDLAAAQNCSATITNSIIR